MMNHSRISAIVVLISAFFMILLIFAVARGYAQIEFLGTVSIDSTKTDSLVVKYTFFETLEPLLTKWVGKIKKKDSTEVLFIPDTKVYIGQAKYKIAQVGIEYHPYTYESATDNLSLIPPEKYYVIEYNLKNGKWKRKKYKGDTYDDYADKDAAKKIKDKIKEKEKPPKKENGL